MSSFGNVKLGADSPTLISTKLQRPTIGPDILPNPQVTERLEKGRYRKLNLISVPPGYGKSILVTIWAKECSCPVGWLSLDKNDYDLTIFLSYFVTAAQTLFSDARPKTEALLNANRTLPSD